MYRREANTFLTAARAAEAIARKQSTYNNWSVVEDRYSDAAESFKKAGDTARQKWALGEATRTKRIYENLDNKRAEQAQSARKGTNGENNPRKYSATQCKALKDQYDALKRNNADTSAISWRLNAACPQ
jgi:RPA family protein